MMERALAMQGFAIVRNNPYAGGFSTEHYGRPALGLHALQIEINRALYMDEERIERTAGIKRITQAVTTLMRAIGEVDWRFLRSGMTSSQAAQ